MPESDESVAASEIGKGKGVGVGKDGVAKNIASLCESLFKGGVYGEQGKFKTPDECVCYVSNLPHDTTGIDLYKVFSPYGSIPPNGVKVQSSCDRLHHYFPLKYLFTDFVRFPLDELIAM